MGLLVIEIVLAAGVSATLSRGAILVLLCTGVCMHRLSKRHIATKKQHESRLINWILFNPTWRIVLLFCNPGLWKRTMPTYVAQDASIFNRFELWKGALKLFTSTPLGGLGYKNTGVAYMNWFQNTDQRTYYNGLVNSYLQIGAAWGFVALFGLLFISFLGIMSAITLARENNSAGTLCLLLMLAWTISSLFSSMLASPLLFFPPLAAALWAILANLKNWFSRHVAGQTAKSASGRVALVRKFSPSQHWAKESLYRNTVFCSAAASTIICLFLFTTGHALAWGDLLSIRSDKQGVISITNEQTSSGKLCVIYVDEEAIGRHYGKELRKFLIKMDIGNCIVVSKLNQMADAEKLISHAELIIMSGVTVTHVQVINGTAKYVLLRPAFIPKTLHCESIQSIVLPEIDRSHPLRSLDFNQTCLSKLHLVPFNEAFETSWSKYITI